MDHTLTKQTPVIEYARHLLALHEFDSQGKGDGAEADAIRELMDASWYAMTTQERERMGGLSEDLYAIAQGGPPRTAMNDQEIVAWCEERQDREAQYQRGDIDGWLAFLRKPRPKDSPWGSEIPPAVIHLLQARSWSELKDIHTATIFLLAAEEHDPQLTELLFQSAMGPVLKTTIASASS